MKPGGGGGAPLVQCSCEKSELLFPTASQTQNSPSAPPGSCHTANIYIQRKKKNVSQSCKLTSCLTRPLRLMHFMLFLCFLHKASPPFVFKRRLLAL